MAGLLPTDTLLGCTGDQSAYVGDNAVVRAVVYRVNLVTGGRTKIAEVAPADRAGLLRVGMTVYRDDGHYAYDYNRGVSTLYVATPGK